MYQYLNSPRGEHARRSPGAPQRACARTERRVPAMLVSTALLASLLGACEATYRSFGSAEDADASDPVMTDFSPIEPRPQGDASAPAEGSSASGEPAPELGGATPLAPTEATGGAAPDCPDGGSCRPDPCPDCSAPLELGEPCAEGADCASGTCSLAVDEIPRCCESNCSGVECQRCSLEGACVAAPSFAAECPEVICPSDDVCRDFEQSIAAGTCTEAGCSTAADCSFEWKPAAREGAACECDEASCALSVAEACAADGDCASGACRPTAAGANLCCAQPCAGNEVCRGDGNGCEPEPVCSDGQTRCASSTYQLCVGGQWATQQECGALGCDVSLNGCRRGAGDPCTSSADCGEGVCRQASNGAQVCCTAACDSACRVCTPAGTSCQLLNDDAACGTVVCPSDSTCRNYPNAVSTNRCRSGSCGTPAELCGFTAQNAGLSCSALALCDGSGNCSVPKGNLGDSCSSDNDCASGQCADGVCCNTDCSGPCMTCNAAGTCVAPPTDTACSPVACPATSDCTLPSQLTTNLCAALGQCKDARSCPAAPPAPQGTPCDEDVSEFRLCNGRGACVDPSVTCGTSSCAIDEDTVCCYRDGPGGTVARTCEPRSNCPAALVQNNALVPSGSSPVACDASSDCRTGASCCMTLGGGGESRPVRCSGGCNSTQVVASLHQVCRRPSGESEPCSGAFPSCSRTDPRFPGWAFCNR